MRNNIIPYLIMAIFYSTIFGITYHFHGIEWATVMGLAIIATNQIMKN